MNTATALRAIALQNAAADWAARARIALDRLARAQTLAEKWEHADEAAYAQAMGVTPAALARSIITD